MNENEIRRIKEGKSIKKSKAERIMTIYNWSRFILLVLFILAIYIGVRHYS